MKTSQLKHYLNGIYLISQCEVVERLLLIVLQIVITYSEAERTSIGNIDASSVCARFDERNPGREELFFRCIQCPSDKIKLACVVALHSVPVRRLAAREVGRMVSYVRRVQDVTIGQTELILAGCFKFLASLLLCTDAVGSYFRTFLLLLLSFS